LGKSCEVPTERDFSELAAKWAEDTLYLSSATDIVLHPNYQRIIGMGPRALPWILRDLEQTGRDWFWALWAITGENPVDQSDAGNFPRMTQAWLEWGRKRSYI
jgi:hypothetical protein